MAAELMDIRYRVLRWIEGEGEGAPSYHSQVFGDQGWQFTIEELTEEDAKSKWMLDTDRDKMKADGPVRLTLLEGCGEGGEWFESRWFFKTAEDAMKEADTIVRRRAGAWVEPMEGE